jgi:hypothetical protein
LRENSNLDTHENMLRKCMKELFSDPAQLIKGLSEKKTERLAIERLRPRKIKLGAKRDFL